MSHPPKECVYKIILDSLPSWMPTSVRGVFEEKMAFQRTHNLPFSGMKLEEWEFVKPVFSDLSMEKHWIMLDQLSPGATASLANSILIFRFISEQVHYLQNFSGRIKNLKKIKDDLSKLKKRTKTNVTSLSEYVVKDYNGEPYGISWETGWKAIFWQIDDNIMRMEAMLDKQYFLYYTLQMICPSPQKLNTQSAKTIFAMRYFTLYMRQLFGKPFSHVVAEILQCLLYTDCSGSDILSNTRDIGKILRDAEELPIPPSLLSHEDYTLEKVS